MAVEGVRSPAPGSGSLIQAMEEACDQIDAVAVQGWIWHSRRFFPRCLANDDIACDVDEILWPDPARRRDDA